jgi:AGZA family xanthine/uracil permease-like MFS transporter
MEKTGIMRGYQWIQKGDLNAFFGLMLDNMTQLVILAGILIGIFHYPEEIVLYRMIPGTAIGVLIGDLIYTWLAFRLARQSGRYDVTAMPLGIDTVSLFGLSFGVLGPVYLATKDPEFSWQVGMALLILMGIFKLICSFFGPWLRRIFPRAGLLGAIAAVALLLIAFLPALKTFAHPIVGFVSLGIILISLTARITLPKEFPGALAAVLLGTTAFFLMKAYGISNDMTVLEKNLLDFRIALPYPTLAFLPGLTQALNYLPLALPFALATVIGGVDNTESAAAAGDEYSTRAILLTEGFATFMAGLCGGVIQNTPYIGHPAYKSMGGRAAYTLATALFIGLGGIFGYLSLFVHLIPEAAIAPILIFIGLEITAQAFMASPKAHAPAVAICFLPVIADLILIQYNSLLSNVNLKPEALTGEIYRNYQTILVLANGFIFTAMLWGAILANLIDKKFRLAASFALAAGVCSLFGLIHSPMPNGDLVLFWQISSSVPLQFAIAYSFMALIFIFIGKNTDRNIS